MEEQPSTQIQERETPKVNIQVNSRQYVVGYTKKLITIETSYLAFESLLPLVAVIYKYTVHECLFAKICLGLL